MGQVFYRMSHNLEFSDVFLMVGLMYWFFGTKSTGVKCHSHHHIISRLYFVSVTYTNDANLDHLVKVVFAMFLSPQ